MMDTTLLITVFIACHILIYLADAVKYYAEGDSTESVFCFLMFLASSFVMYGFTKEFL